MKKLTPEKLKKLLFNYSYDQDAATNDIDMILEILYDLNLLDHDKVQYPSEPEANDGEA